MRKFYFFLAILLTAMTVQAKGSGIPSEIFKNGKVKYEKSTNTLVLEDGFKSSRLAAPANSARRSPMSFISPSAP